MALRNQNQSRQVTLACSENQDGGSIRSAAKGLQGSREESRRGKGRPGRVWLPPPVFWFLVTVTNTCQVFCK